MRKIIKINNLNDVKEALDSLKPIENYINTLNENSFEYEDLCEKVEKVLIEIEEVLIGGEEYNNENVANAYLRMVNYWNYLKGEIDFDELIKTIKEHSSELLLNYIE